MKEIVGHVHQEVTKFCFVSPRELSSQPITYPTVGAKINLPFPFLTQQEKRSRTDRAIGVPC